MAFFSKIALWKAKLVKYKTNIKISAASLPNIWYRQNMQKIYFLFCNICQTKVSKLRCEQRRGVSMQQKKQSSSGWKNSFFWLASYCGIWFYGSSIVKPVLQFSALRHLNFLFCQTEKKSAGRRRLWGDQGYWEGSFWGGSTRAEDWHRPCLCHEDPPQGRHGREGAGEII